MSGTLSFEQFTGQPPAGVAPAGSAPVGSLGLVQQPNGNIGTPGGGFPMVQPHQAPDGGGMTNLSDADFAKFQAGQKAAATVTSGGTPAGMSFEQFTKPVGAAGGQSPPPMSGIVPNIGAGMNDALAGTLGAPVDLATSALNLIPRGINAAAGTSLPTIQNPIGGSASIKSAFGLIGADPRSVAPADETEQLARAGGAGAAAMMLPWGVARALPVMGGLAGAAQKAFGAGSAGTMAAAGTGAGVTGQIAENEVPDALKPLANFTGQMIGGGLVLGTVTATKALMDGGVSLASSLAAPLTEAGRQGLAAQRIAGAATDLPAVRDALSQPAPELVPGSQPTTFQATGDPGLGTLERVAAKNTPAPFIERAADQNAARVTALQQLAPETASPDAIGAAFRQQLSDLNAQHQVAITQAQTAARASVDALGGAVPAGADQQTTALQAYGQQLRGGLADANAAAKAQEGQLWRAIDPTGTLTVDMTPIRQAANSIKRAMPANAAPMDGEPGRVFAVAQLVPRVQPFSELAALRSRLTDAMSSELMDNGRTQTYGRMSQLLDAVHDAMAGKVQQQAGDDARAVAAGTMDPEQTMLARLQAQADTWSRDRVGQPSIPKRPGSGGTRVAEPAGAGPAGLLGTPGGNRAAGLGSGSAGRDTGLASEQAAVAPTFDAAAAARYQAARSATAQRHATFTNSPGVGAVLAPGRRAGDFRLGDSQVPSAIFNAGKGAAERVQAFIAAGGSRADLINGLQDYAAFDLRRAAETQEGTLDQAKYKRWVASHTEAMSALPELRQRFASAAAARETLDNATAAHVEATKAFENSAARHFLGDGDPVTKVGRILNSDTALPTMKELARMTASDPAARAGLQRAVVEHVLRDMRGNAASADGSPLLRVRSHLNAYRIKDLIQSSEAAMATPAA